MDSLKKLYSDARAFGRGVRDNTVPYLLGGPVDLAALPMQLAGVPVGNAPVGGSAWIRQQLERAGVTPPSQGDPLEAFGGMVGGAVAPAAGRVAGRAAFAAEQNAAAPTEARSGPLGTQLGAVGPKRYTMSVKDAVQPKANTNNTGYVNNLFDTSDASLERSMQMTQQTPLARQQPRMVKDQPKFSERVDDMMNSRRVRQGIEQAIDNGFQQRNWYGLQPLYDAGAQNGLSYDDVRRLMRYQANASQRSNPQKQTGVASYHWMLDRQGQPIPESTPSPYGHLGEVNRRAEDIRNGDMITTPKMQSYDANFGGNWQPGTMDTHAVRLPAMLTEDPRWLANSVDVNRAGEKVTLRPREMFARGELDMKTALKNPQFWESAPSGAEYGAFESLWGDVAKKKGLATAQGQAAGWVGGGGLTGLAASPELYLDTLARRVTQVAQQRGVSPQVLLDQFLRGSTALGAGGAAAGASGLFGEPPRD